MKLRSAVSVALAMTALATARATEPIQVGFLWHMHQPIYYPGESITQTEAAGHYSFDLYDIFNQRVRPLYDLAQRRDR